MERYFTLLNLSDLHIDVNKENQKSDLEQFYLKLKAFVGNNHDWCPDYIVLPGDIVNEVTTANYEAAKEYIGKIMNLCGSGKSQLIAVPGNHDKEYKGFKEKEKEICKQKAEEITRVFNEYIDSLNASERNKKEMDLIDTAFRKLQGESFSEYSAFASEFLQDVNTFGRMDHESTKYLACYKVFPRHEVCFLMLNTEFLTLRSSYGTSKVVLGGGILQKLSEEIRRKYPYYTVITVMHHSPHELEWSEKNTTDALKVNPYVRLLETSDVIFSAHNHHIRTHFVDRLWEKVLHIQMGSLACSPGMGEHTYLNSASLVKIDSVCETASLVYACRKSMEWEFDKASEARQYTLKRKYCADYLPAQENTWRTSAETLYVKSVGDFHPEEIHQLVLARFYDVCLYQENVPFYIHQEGENTVEIHIQALENFEPGNIKFTKKPNYSLHYIVYATKYEDEKLLMEKKSEMRTTSLLFDVIFTPIFVLKR